MRLYLFGLSLFLPLLGACAGKNVVAGEEKTKAEQLEAAVPPWCATTCARLRTCTSTPCHCDGDVCDCPVSVDEKCEGQCKAAFDPYTNAGEYCATVGEKYKSCVDQVSCGDSASKDPCVPTDAERAACPNPHQDESESVAAPSVVAGPSTGSGGAGPTSNASPATCSGSYGLGGGAPAEGSHVSCEEGRNSCSDGHEYSWICAVDSQGLRSCSCSVDRRVTGGFVPVSDCPELSLVNAGCGWALTH